MLRNGGDRGSSREPKVGAVGGGSSAVGSDRQDAVSSSKDKSAESDDDCDDRECHVSQRDYETL